MLFQSFHLYLALEDDLTIIPVINKIDLPSADPDKVKKEIEDVIGIPCDEAVLASAKEGIGIKEILEQVVKYVPAPTGDSEEPLQALIFDSIFDSYRGVIPTIRIVNGKVKKGDKIRTVKKFNEWDGKQSMPNVGIGSKNIEKNCQGLDNDHQKKDTVSPDRQSWS